MDEYKDHLYNFIKNNENLIMEYDLMDSVIPMECCEDDIISIFKNIKKINKKASFDITLNRSLNMSIKYNVSVTDSLEYILSNLTTEGSKSNTTQAYFREINDIYRKNRNDYNIEFKPENRDQIIKMNLKTVISVAKRYQGLGLNLNELISAGNMGLCMAFDKFDPSKSTLRDDVLCVVNTLPEISDFVDIKNSLEKYFEYGDLKKKFTDFFIPGNTYQKKKIIQWVKSNVFNAKFNSVAVMWIRAYILIELDNFSRVVRKPKAEIYKDKKETGTYQRESIVDIDAPVSDDSDTPISGFFQSDNDINDLEVSESYGIFKKGLSILLDGVKQRDRSIFLKKFGIGLPRPMLPKEIAEQEGLSIARISQIFQTVIEQMQRNQAKYNIDSDVLFDAVHATMSLVKGGYAVVIMIKGVGMLAFRDPYGIRYE